MAKNKAKMNKFLTGAITATMVATAVAPTAALADETKIDFSDVDKESSHYPNIIKAAERGLMTGYEGKFDPLSTMTRGQVVKALGKYLVGQEGVSLDQYLKDKDLVNKVQPFEDVPANYKDQELYKYSLVVRDAEAFTGNNNNLVPGNDITRQQMAKVLVEAFELEDLEDVDAKVADIDTVFETYVGYVETLAKHGVTKADDGKFRPAESVTRQQMASFLNRSFDVVHGEDEVEEPAVVSVSATNGSITVKFSEAPETVPTAADFKVTQTINGGTATTVAPTVIYDATTKTATLTVPQVEQKDVAQTVTYSVTYNEESKTASFTVAAPTKMAAVVAAGTDGDDTVYVFFNQAVDEKTATDVGNYRVDRDNTVDTDAIVTPDEVELNTTAVGPYGVGQVAILTFPAETLTASEVGEVRVANVKSNGVVIPTTTIGYAAATAAADSTAPTFAASSTLLTDGITVPTATLSINQGKEVVLTANPTDGENFVVGGQYRILKSDNTVAVNWTAMEAQNAPFDNVNEPIKASIKTNNLGVGTYTVQVRATDAATNTSAIATANSTATLTVLPAQGDVTAPNAVTTSYVNYSNFAITTGTQQQAAKTVRVEGTAVDTSNLAAAAAGVAKVEYRVRAYNTVTGEYTTTTNWTTANPADGVWGGASENYFFVTPALTIGSSYVIDVRATDIYGNVGPITQANDGSAPAVSGTTDTATTPGLAAPIAGTFTISGDTIAPSGGTVLAQAPFTLGTTLAPSDERRVQLASTVDATDGETAVVGVEFAVYRINGAGSRELVRNYSSVGVTAVDGDFNSGSEAYTIDYTLPNASGEYVFEVQAIDAAGNRSSITSTTTVTHVLDVDAPTATIVPNTATTDNKHDFIITFNEAVVKSGGGVIDATDFAIRNALGTVARDLSTSTLTPVAGSPNKFILDIRGADQASVTAGNILTVGVTTGVADIVDLAGNEATASYQIKSTDLE